MDEHNKQHLYNHLKLNHTRQVQNGEHKKAKETFEKMALLSLYIDELWLPEIEIVNWNA